MNKKKGFGNAPYSASPIRQGATPPTSPVPRIVSTGKYLSNNRSFVLKLTTGELNCTAYGEAFRNLENYNLFGGDPSFLGGKIGKTLAAKETMLAVFDVPFGNTLRPVIIIVLGSDDVGQDISTIRSYIQANYRGQFSLR